MSQILVIFMSVSRLMILIKFINFKKKTVAMETTIFVFAQNTAYSNMKTDIFLNINETWYYIKSKY